MGVVLTVWHDYRLRCVHPQFHTSSSLLDCCVLQALTSTYVFCCKVWTLTTDFVLLLRTRPTHTTTPPPNLGALTPTIHHHPPIIYPSRRLRQPQKHSSQLPNSRHTLLTSDYRWITACSKAEGVGSDLCQRADHPTKQSGWVSGTTRISTGLTWWEMVASRSANIDDE